MHEKTVKKPPSCGNLVCFSSMFTLSSSSSPFPTFSNGNGNGCCSSISLPPTSLLHLTNFTFRSSPLKISATLDDRNAGTPSALLQQDPKLNAEVEKSVEVLKTAAKTRKVPANDILTAFTVIEKAKLDPSGFLSTLGGSESPGRTWMLIFTAQKRLKGGRYFPLTAVQRFDAAAMRIENGVFLGPLGSLTFEGRLSWKKRILAFVFECIRIKVGPLKPLELSLGKADSREPTTKDPFFTWFYIDDEIAVARGRSGGTAFWCRCRRVTN